MNQFQIGSDTKAMLTYDAKKKGALVAYLLWFFLGCAAAHHFYVGKKGSGIFLLLLCFFGIITSVVGIGVVLLGIWFVWWTYDAFQIPGWIQTYNANLIESMTTADQKPITAPLTAEEAKLKLELIADMKEKGQITEAEYEKAKAQIMLRIA